MTAHSDFPSEKLEGSPATTSYSFCTDWNRCVLQQKGLNQMCRQGRQCWQLTEGCLHHGDAELVLEQTLARFFSLPCLDHQTPGLKGRTSCSNIGCCILCREIKQEGTSSWQFKDFRFRCREWKKNLPHNHSTWARRKAFATERHRALLERFSDSMGM